MVNRRATIVVTCLLAGILSNPGTMFAKAKRSTPEERAKAVQLAQELERQPASEDAVHKRRWLLDFYQRVPDITITVCDLLGPFPKAEHPYFSYVLAQSMFSSGAFMIEHPDQASDQVAVQTAGIEGALQVYDVFVKAMPEDRLPYLDDLVAKRNDGSLKAYMQAAVPKGCK
jgi:hypothetical protein